MKISVYLGHKLKQLFYKKWSGRFQRLLASVTSLFKSCVISRRGQIECVYRNLQLTSSCLLKAYGYGYRYVLMHYCIRVRTTPVCVRTVEERASE
jgi:hypothetical protein